MYMNKPSIYTSFMSREHWDKVHALLDTVDNRRAEKEVEPKFGARGTVLHENWGAAFEQVVHMMYWVDRICRYSEGHKTTAANNTPVSSDTLLRLIAFDLKTTPQHIHGVMLKDPDYAV
jgi:hypothetical protein